MKFILILILMQMIAAQADDTILIKRRSGKSKAILNKKFIFMNAGARREKAFIQNDQSSSNSDLAAFNAPVSIKTKPLLAKKRKLLSQREAAQVKESSVDIHDEDNWQDYEREVEGGEDLSVRASLL